MIPVTRTMSGPGRRYAGTAGHQYSPVTRPARPIAGGPAAVMMPLPALGTAGGTFNGMDPSDPRTYVRPWNPQPGMISYLNWDGAQTQGRTETGGVYGLPARYGMPVGGRPNRRPR